MHPTVLLFILFIAASHLTNSVAVAQAPTEASRVVAARSIPVPDTVSAPMQALIAQQPAGMSVPKTAEEWKALVAAAATIDLARIASLRKQFDVTVESRVIGNVPCFVITPKVIPAKNRNRLLVHVHGGAYVFGTG